MNKLDKAARDTLKDIYQQFKIKREICVSSSKYRKTLIDYLVNQGLFKKLDASTLNGWAYILLPTYEGEMVFAGILNSPLSKVETFIEQGEVIMKEEYQHNTKSIDYISGPKSDQWFSEISIFNSRVLANHPLHDQIAEVCKNHNTFSSHKNMMGYLKALASDNDFWNEYELKESTIVMRNRKTFEQMLSEDIERCEEYLSNPNDEKYGQKLYIEITSRYDSIISDLGNGLYQYYSDGHFYDPNISGESLLHNLRVLCGKMTAYQNTNFSVIKDYNVNKLQKKYDVFISHANRDKIDYVNQLKQSIDKLKVNVFYDNDTIEWGDRWKDKILEGVAQSEFAIIIISENFFGQEWTEKELSELLNRQNSSGQKIILPILYKISVAQLKEHYPAVADIQVLDANDYSCDEIALKFACQLIKRLK